MAQCFENLNTLPAPVLPPPAGQHQPRHVRLHGLGFHRHQQLCGRQPVPAHGILLRGPLAGLARQAARAQGQGPVWGALGGPLRWGASGRQDLPLLCELLV